MYHDEKVVDGVLYVKGTPNGAWERLTSARADALLLMHKLRQESPEHYEWVLKELDKLENKLVPLRISIAPQTSLDCIGIDGGKASTETLSPRKAGW